MDKVFSSMMTGGNYQFSFPMVGKLSTLDWTLCLSEGNDIALAAPEPMLLPVGLTARVQIPKEEFKIICGDEKSGMLIYPAIKL